MAAVALGLASAAGCATHGLSFVTDERVTITAPDDRAEVTLPVTVKWEVADFDIHEGDGRFGVFLDRAPPPPGRPPEWLFRGDAACKGRGAARCATPEFLADRRVFQTTETELTITHVPSLTGNDKRREFHEVTVVLLDADGERVNEGAWSVQFSVVSGARDGGRG